MLTDDTVSFAYVLQILIESQLNCLVALQYHHEASQNGGTSHAATKFAKVRGLVTLEAANC